MRGERDRGFRHRLCRDRHRADDRLRGGRQPVARGGMKLGVEPAVAAHRHVLRGDGRVHAPGDAIDQREIGRAERSGQWTGTPTDRCQNAGQEDRKNGERAYARHLATVAEATIEIMPRACVNSR